MPSLLDRLFEATARHRRRKVFGSKSDNMLADLLPGMYILTALSEGPSDAAALRRKIKLGQSEFDSEVSRHVQLGIIQYRAGGRELELTAAGRRMLSGGA